MKNFLAIFLAVGVSVQANPFFYLTLNGATTSSLLTSLVGYWKLDEASGSSRADSAGSSTLAESAALSNVAGIVGNAVSFASSRYLSVADNAALSMGDIDFSVTCWFKVIALGNGYFIHKGTAATNAFTEYGLLYSGGQIYFIVGNGGTSAYAATAVSTNTWYFMAGYHDASSNVVGMSLNGGAFITTGYSGGSHDSTGRLTLGADNSGGSTVTGYLDELGIWKRLLTASEFSALYNSGSGITHPFNGTSGNNLPTSLIAEWKLNEASGDATDSEPTGTPQTLTQSGSPVSASAKVGTASRALVKSSSQSLSRSDSADLSVGDIDFTIDAWVYMSSKPASIMGIVGKGSSSGAGTYEYALYWYNPLDRFQFAISNGATTAQATANTFGAPSLSTWYYIRAEHDATANTIKISVNNGPEDSTSTSIGSWDSTESFYIGYTFGSTRYWDGRIDEVGFWKRVLTPAEKAERYNSGNGVEIY